MTKERETEYLKDTIERLTGRIRALEKDQPGNGFVPYQFLPALELGTGTPARHGKHPVMGLISNGEYCTLELVMPRSAANLQEAYLLYIPSGTGTWDYTIDVAGGHCAEDESEHTDTQTANGIAVTNDELECLNILPVLADFSVGDHVGVEVTRDAVGGSTTQILIVKIVLR